jgi:hypothetical protein
VRRQQGRSCGGSTAVSAPESTKPGGSSRTRPGPPAERWSRPRRRPGAACRRCRSGCRRPLGGGSARHRAGSHHRKGLPCRAQKQTTAPARLGGRGSAGTGPGGSGAAQLDPAGKELIMNQEVDLHLPRPALVELGLLLCPQHHRSRGGPVGRTLPRECGAAGRVDPARGATVSTFFTNYCYYLFADEYRREYRSERRSVRTLRGPSEEPVLDLGLDVSLYFMHPLGRDPEHVALDRAEIRQLLRMATHSRIPEIVFLVAEGCTAKEVGCHLNMSENAVIRLSASSAQTLRASRKARGEEDESRWRRRPSRGRARDERWRARRALRFR